VPSRAPFKAQYSRKSNSQTGTVDGVQATTICCRLPALLLNYERAWNWGGEMGDKTLDQRVNELELAVATEREANEALKVRLQIETMQRSEALLTQEHRFLAALRNLYNHRNHPDLRWAALLGVISSFLGRATAFAAVAAIALAPTLLLTLHANYLLTIQNEKMDTQTVVVDAQRRAQIFQAEFATVSSEVTQYAQEMKRREQEGRMEATALWSRATVFYKKAFPSNKENSDQLEHYENRWRTAGHRYFHVLEGNVDAMGAAAGPVAKVSRKTMLDLENLMGEIYGARDKNELVRKNFRIDGTQMFVVLDANNAARVAGLSRIAKPFPRLDVSVREPAPLHQSFWSKSFNALVGPPDVTAKLAKEETSVERGQLVTFLTSAGVSTDIPGVDFSSADMSNRVVETGHIGNMRSSKFRRSTLVSTTFYGDMSLSDFSCARFERGSLGASNVREAEFRLTFFQFTSLTSEQLAEGRFHDVTFDRVTVDEGRHVPLPDNIETLADYMAEKYPGRSFDHFREVRIVESGNEERGYTLRSVERYDTNYGAECRRD
jgi:hypothetical protein